MIYQEVEEKMGQYYYSFSTQILGKRYPQWMVACRLLGLSPADFAKLLKEEYNAIIGWYPETNYLSKKWANLEDERRWRLFINKMAREKGCRV
jgi:hypothetical protein